jgi:hypothetical protein
MNRVSSLGQGEEIGARSDTWSILFTQERAGKAIKQLSVVSK